MPLPEALMRRGSVVDSVLREAFNSFAWVCVRVTPSIVNVALSAGSSDTSPPSKLHDHQESLPSPLIETDVMSKVPVRILPSLL